MPTRDRAFWFQILLLLLIPLALGLPTLAHDFVWDDHSLLLENSAVVGPFSIRQIFASRVVLESGATIFYRPLQLLSHALEFRAFGANPGGYHAVSMVLNALNVALVYLVARFMSAGGWGAFTAAAIFAVLPVHAEAVSFVAARSDLLATLFSLLSLLAAIGSSRGPSGGKTTSAAAGAAYLCALLSKEMAVLVPVACLCWVWCEQSPGASVRGFFRRNAPLLAAYTVAAATYAALRALLPPESPDALLMGPDPGGALRRFTLIVRALVDPSSLQTYWPFVSAGWSGASYAGIGLLLLLLAALLLPGRQRCRRIFLGVWFLAAVAPILKPVLIKGPDMACRYLYLASAAPAWAAALLWPAKPRRAISANVAAAAALGAAALILAFGLLWLRESRSWRNDIALFTRMTRELPQNAIAFNELGVALSRARRIGEALPSYRKAVALDPGYADARYNLGLLLSETGGYAEAAAHLRMYLFLAPTSPRAAFVSTMIPWLEANARSAGTGGTVPSK
jgi:tetratricopeptide (TPR) repeat protein